ncbi:MAG: YdcF family protein [Candidatus Synoicihabitans palmerolidicus]|nr:YdcF family protein [Candidatus Synoicihabitans palmerolidicus]
MAPRIVFTGGVGAGSADLTQPEANAFAAELAEKFPEIPTAAVLLETRSTNTGENVRMLQVETLAAHWPLQTVALVASPYRQRRVALTWRKQGPGGAFFNCPPATCLVEERTRFAAKGENFIDHLPGEVDRLTTYAERGWITAKPVPLAVVEATAALRKS